jgi:hypothetical protein
MIRTASTVTAVLQSPDVVEIRLVEDDLTDPSALTPQSFLSALVGAIERKVEISREHVA